MMGTRRKHEGSLVYSGRGRREGVLAGRARGSLGVTEETGKEEERKPQDRSKKSSTSSTRASRGAEWGNKPYFGKDRHSSGLQVAAMNRKGT